MNVFVSKTRQRNWKESVTLVLPRKSQFNKDTTASKQADSISISMSRFPAGLPDYRQIMKY